MLVKGGTVHFFYNQKKKPSPKCLDDGQIADKVNLADWGERFECKAQKKIKTDAYFLYASSLSHLHLYSLISRC